MGSFRTNRVSCVSYFRLGQLSLFRHATVSESGSAFSSCRRSCSIKPVDRASLLTLLRDQTLKCSLLYPLTYEHGSPTRGNICKLCSVQLRLSGLIGTASHPDIQKIRIMGFSLKTVYIGSLKFGCYYL
jgi:hypothetical protein